jgi:hypothetical protein
MLLLLIVAALFQASGPQLVTIDRGDMSALETPREAVARTEAEWTALWKLHAPARPAPVIDFTKNMVVGVFLGTRPTSGFSVEIVGASREGETLVVRYVERRPARDAITAQILTAPFHIVALPAHRGPVRFVLTSS